MKTEREQLLQHSLYSSLRSAQDVRVFMEHHVFAVWDFMSLLKRLQCDLTCVRVPWVPAEHANHARLINEIVVAEESDEDGQGGFISHFELYLQAMDEVGADTHRIRRFVSVLRDGADVQQALRWAEVPESVARFVSSTMRLAQGGSTVEVAASFFYGREDIIPEMFDALLGALPQERTGKLRYYLQRHIEIDGDTHGPLAQRLLDELCSGRPERQRQAQEARRLALHSRVALWDGVVAALATDASARVGAHPPALASI